MPVRLLGSTEDNHKRYSSMSLPKAIKWQNKGDLYSIYVDRNNKTTNSVFVIVITKQNIKRNISDGVYQEVGELCQWLKRN